MSGEERWRVFNEFASVMLRVVPYGRGARLEIKAGRVEETGVLSGEDRPEMPGAIDPGVVAVLAFQLGRRLEPAGAAKPQTGPPLAQRRQPRGGSSSGGRTIASSLRSPARGTGSGGG